MGVKVVRIEKDQMSENPHQLIGAVICIGGRKRRNCGSGILISKDLVLTCAHVVYSQELKMKYEKIEFYLGQHGVLGECCEVEQSMFPRQYKQLSKKNREFDFALLKLKKPVKKDYNFLELSFDFRQIEKATLSIFGYPQKYYMSIGNLSSRKDLKESVDQYGLTRKDHILNSYTKLGFLIHRISTLPGQSGGPLIRTD